MEMEEKILAVLADFRKTGSIRKTAQNFSCSTGTVRKMLITSGEWNNKTSTDIAALRRLHSDWTKAKIAEHLQISLKTIEIYTPYEEYRSLSGPKHSNIAADETVVETGDCGDKVTWILQKDGTLTISGIGPMWDYSGNCWGVWGNPRPKWWMRRDGVKVFRIIIEKASYVHAGELEGFYSKDGVKLSDEDVLAW